LESGDLDSLNEKFQSISLEYNTFKYELKIEDAGQELQKLNKLTREEDNLRNQVNSLRKSTESCDKEKEAIESDINNLNLKKAKIEESGKEARKSIDRQREKMEQLSEGREPSKYMVEVRNLMDSIRTTEASLKKKLDIEKEDRQKLTEQKSGEEKNLSTLKNLLEEQHGRLIKSIDENGFEDACEAANCLMDKKDMESLKEEIKSFDDNLKFLENNIVGAEKRLGGRSMDDAQWQDINAKKINISSALEEKTRIIAGEQREIAGMEKDLEEVKKLDKQMKEAQHVKDLLGDIEKLTSGSKFVEFAAMSQLRYIAIEASKRLMEITNGRYALELDSSGEFVMRDDFNGGVKRSVDTLSGGETFLTSLSLAIALSSHIQLKGSAPLEFFFLDEGFGTLDNELLEVVMSSLERLQNEKFSVGIISHVDELKARVPVKLVVTPSRPGVGGSKVRIEYS
jgi:exonuclease SbcC